VNGGTSLFVDAFAAAEKLRQTDPKAFDLLASTPVPFHYVNDGHHLHRNHTTFELARFPDILTGKFELININYSPPFQAPLPPNTSPAFFDAFAKFSELLEDKRAVYRHTLRETDAVVFDNRRVLHARTAFTDGDVMEDGDGVNRWLKGCYFDANLMMDRGRILREKAEKGQL
jgi:gamma-butyrobetaine dioxygenase